MEMQPIPKYLSCFEDGKSYLLYGKFEHEGDDYNPEFVVGFYAKRQASMGNWWYPNRDKKYLEPVRFVPTHYCELPDRKG